MTPLMHTPLEMPLLGKPPWRVLVFPGGTEIGLEINRSLRDCKEVELFAAGQPIPSASEFRFSRQTYLQATPSEGWLEALLAIVRDNRIDCIYPGHDEVLASLAEYAALLPVPVMGFPPETCRICRSKSMTYATLKDHVPVPRVFSANETLEFPVFVKPDRGQGSHGARRVDDADSLARILASEQGMLVSECLSGPEYTVDCFTSATSGLVVAQARERIRTRSGISMQTRFIDDPEFERHARAITGRLSLRGAWFFQMKRDREGQLRLLEVAPRIAGTMAMTRVAGMNFPLMTLYDAAGHNIRPLLIDGVAELSRSLENHYRLDFDYSAVYVDLDDTLLLRRQVNTRLIQFLYQCLNRGKPVVLVTRHAGDLQDTLRKHRLGTMFDRIHHLDATTCKSSVIRESDAILIDDSFAERQRVAKATGIRTFEPSGIECLIDARA